MLQERFVKGERIMDNIFVIDTKNNKTGKV
jgi:hypothetical protein